MFELALRAGLPLIKVVTTDVLNYMEVIQYIAGADEVVRKVAGAKDLETNTKILVWYAPKMLSFKSVYSKLMDEDKVIVLVNPEKDHPLMFDAGELATPKELIAKELSDAGFEERQVRSLLPSLSGLNLIKVGEVCRLAMAKYGELNAQSASAVKMMVTDPTGLIGIDTKQDFYLPDERLDRFIDDEGWFLIGAEDERLRPRGMLLHGMPGTGKSQAAKYIANRWKIPLYLMDLSSIMNKYVGQSENNMRAMLSRVDAEEPCVLLLDEVEKLFSSNGGDTGTTTRLLGQLLWWLAEHSSRVFTVLTSNDISGLPEELYRPGRIDKVYEFGGLQPKDALDFAKQYVTKFDDVKVKLTDKDVPSVNELGVVSHAAVVGAVKLKVKEQIIKDGGVKWDKM